MRAGCPPERPNKRGSTSARRRSRQTETPIDARIDARQFLRTHPAYSEKLARSHGRVGAEPGPVTRTAIPHHPEPRRIGSTAHATVCHLRDPRPRPQLRHDRGSGRRVEPPTHQSTRTLGSGRHATSRGGAARPPSPTPPPAGRSSRSGAPRHILGRILDRCRSNVLSRRQLLHRPDSVGSHVRRAQRPSESGLRK